VILDVIFCLPSFFDRGLHVSLRLYVKKRFGSKRGLLSLAISEGKHRLGFYERYKKIETQKVKRLVFVCSGNICRSPLGEVVAKSLGISAESFGLDTRGGDPADSRVILYASHRKLDLSAHRTRHISEYIPLAGDLLIGMEPMHLERLNKLFGSQTQMTLMGLWLKRPVVYLHDPFNTTPDFFNSCSSLVESASRHLAERVKMEI
jgi:protein-tyrosine phosphatase